MTPYTVGSANSLLGHVISIEFSCKLANNPQARPSTDALTLYGTQVPIGTVGLLRPTTTVSLNIELSVGNSANWHYQS